MNTSTPPKQDSASIAQLLSVLLAHTYALYLKTQGYHWNVEDKEFSMLHSLFEKEYTALSDAVDKTAERIRTLGHYAPASFTAYQKLSKIPDGHAPTPASEMIRGLCADHSTVITLIHEMLKVLHTTSDEGTISFLNDRLQEHEKTLWILNSHLS